MKRSTDRILTTHVGSLTRPPEVLEGILTRVSGQPRDEATFNAMVRKGVQENVRMQAEVGIDVPSDGEVGKPSFAGYITERLGGLQTTTEAPKSADNAMNYPILNEEYPGFMAQYNSMYRTMWMPRSIPRDLVDAAVERTRNERVIVADKITYQGHDDIKRDLAVFKEALQGLQFEEAFVPAATPSRSDEDPEQIYPSEQAYLYAVADAMREEYRAIVDAGFVVQLDLGLPARNQVLPGKPRPTWEELRRASEMQVEAYNHALQGIPEDRVRYHLCWGSMNTPHTSDIPLKDIVDLILKINAQAYSIEAANPRHEHEWMVWASVVGKENVIASTDCGFSQGWSMIRVHPEVQWAKLRTLAEGAALASKELWGRG